jgi:selenocysteine lyase/cysteine desulfurase
MTTLLNTASEAPRIGATPAADAFAELEASMHAALERYANVHRGTGHHSMVSTQLFEEARDVVLEFLGLKKGAYVVVFCSPRRAAVLSRQLEPGSFQMVSSQDLGLSLGVRALAVRRQALPRGAPFQTGGGTTKLVSSDWVIWADGADRFEAGTPAIINVIALARALRLVRRARSGTQSSQGTQSSSAGPFGDSTAPRHSVAEVLYRDELEKHSGRELLEALKETLVGRDVRIPTGRGPRAFTNLDNAASTPTFEPVWDAFRRAWRQPGSVQRAIVEEVKAICAEVLHAPLEDYDVVFTSNTTEAINLAAESLSLGLGVSAGRETEVGAEPTVLTTVLEHSSNDLPWRMVPGHSVLRLSVDSEGFLDLNELDAVLSRHGPSGQQGGGQGSQPGTKRIELVAVSGASNVLGACNELKDISRIVHRHGARLLVDAAQLVAHRRIDMEASGIDALAFSAHKVYAPFGCGVLVVRKGLLRFDAPELERISASGEENVGGIAALGKALVLLGRIGLGVVEAEERALTQRLLTGLAQVPGLTVYGVKAPDSPRLAQRLGVIALSLKGFSPARLATELSWRGGIGVRHGCHCAHLIVKRVLDVGPSLERFQRVIQTLFPRLRFPGLVRVSLGLENGPQDVDTLLEVLGTLASRRPASGQAGAPVATRGEVQQQLRALVEVSAARALGPSPAPGT